CALDLTRAAPPVPAATTQLPSAAAPNAQPHIFDGFGSASSSRGAAGATAGGGDSDGFGSSGPDCARAVESINGTASKAANTLRIWAHDTQARNRWQGDIKVRAQARDHRRARAPGRAGGGDARRAAAVAGVG